MKSKFLFATWMIFLITGFSSNNLFAGDIKYRVVDIPKELLRDAKAVVRNQEIDIVIKSNGKLIQKVKYAITILNKNGISKSYFLQPYDKSMKVSNIKANAYDESGIEIKKKGGYDILDYAMISDGTTYADHRIKAINPEQLDYPYTIEYTYEIDYSEVLSYPRWNPIDDFNVAVQNSKYTVTVSKEAACRYFEKNIISHVKIQNTTDGKVYSWELTNQIAYDDENYCPALADITPVVIIAPSQIEIEGYKGNIDTWKGFGLWINQLNEGRNHLNEITKANILKLVEGITDDKVKIKKLYEYMQNKTRYVSIQIGIGGFQPFDAETVDRLAYGDCKALSNYMKSILEVAGISSKYTLVMAGRENPTIDDTFPSNQFNHAILCVPLTKDTVWLECTSQSNPFNYLSTFTADRQVLIVDSNGGTLIKTPALNPELNLEARKVAVSLDPSGSGFANATNTFHGATYDHYIPVLMSDQIDRKKMVTRMIHIPNFELDNFTVQETKSENPFVTEKLNLTLPNYCTHVGDKLLLCLNLMNKMSESPFQATTRKYPISIKWPVNEMDTVIYELPEGYTLEKIPSKINLQSDFGSYTTEVTKSGSTIQYIRTFEIFKAIHPVDRYDEIVTFFEKIATADENKVLLTRKL